MPLGSDGVESEGAAVPDTLAIDEARFVTGNIMRHVVVMAGTGAIGLIAVFAVDLLNLFYISLLGQQPIAAAIGFAGVVGFFQTSALIGLAIGVGAVVARSIGAGTEQAARHIAGSGLSEHGAVQQRTRRDRSVPLERADAGRPHHAGCQ